MTQPVTARPLRADDLDAVVTIDRERSGRSRKEFYARRFRSLAEEPGGVVAVAGEAEGRVAGFGFARVLDGEFGGAAPVGVIDAVGVDPRAVRRGVATAVLGAVEAALAARGVREVRTQVDWGEQGIGAFFASTGFRPSPRLVLERGLERLDEDEDGAGDGASPVRSMTERDLAAIARLDRRRTGRDRSAYYARKADEALRQSAVRVSLVAELDGCFAGFLMARVDFGEFGRAEPTAVLDTIAVDPDMAGRRIGRRLLEELLLNLASLRAERVVTEVDWRQTGLLAFMARNGFEHSQRLAFDKAIAA